MRSLLALVLLLCTVAGFPVAHKPTHLQPGHKGPHDWRQHCRFKRADYPTVSNLTIFNPDHDTYNLPGVYYARSVELADGTILATWENYSKEPPLVYFPIYKSTDQGNTWEHISNVTDQVNGWGLRYQPFLYQLEETFGDYGPGTLLLAGNSIPTDLNYTQIDVYASTDYGYTWEFVSHVAAGGRAVPDDGLTPVWEPFIMTYEGELIVYYSDQRDLDHGQNLVHQTTTDLVNWAEKVVDTEYYDYWARPGMTTVAKLPNGKYIMTYEYGGAPVSTSYSFPVFYHISEDPRTFNSTESIQLKATDGTSPTSSPYVVWTSYGGVNGTIIVNGQSNSGLFINKALGDSSAWEYIQIDAPRAYTRDLNVIDQDKKLIVLGAGAEGGTWHDITYYTYNLADLL